MNLPDMPPSQPWPPATAGDEAIHEYFTMLLTRHHNHLMAFLMTLVPNWTDAEELLQQTSVVLWRKFSDFEPGTSFLGWACQVARFHALNHLRKQARDRLVFSPELVDVLAQEGVEEAERLHGQRDALRDCLQKLDETSRALLLRCYEPQVTIKTVAEGLGRSSNSLYKTLNRIRETLLRCVQQRLAGKAG